MRELLAKVVALMRSMGSFATRVVRRAGRWVTELVRVPASPMPSGYAEPEAVQAEVEDYAALKRVAGLLAMGDVPKPEDLEAMPGKAVDWLRANDRQALMKILAAQPVQLRAHMRGRAPIVGLVPYEDEAIRDVTAARAAPVARTEVRTRRQALVAAGMTP